MSHDIVPLFLFGMIGWIAWVIFSTIRRYLMAKMQLSVQMRLLEKVDTSQTLLAYVESEAGRRFLESLRVETGEPAMPYQRILGGARTGIILSAFGIGMLVLRSTSVGADGEFTVLGGLVLSLGIGFGLAAAASYLLSRSFGLLRAND